MAPDTERPPPVAPPAAARPGPPSALDTQLARWVHGGLITAGQAERIRAAEAGGGAETGPAETGPETERGPASLVTEALGYVGGVLILVAAATITGRFWTDLGVGGRLGVAFGAAVLLFAAGAALPERLGAAGGRLRSVSWLISAATFAGGLALVGDEVLGAPGDAVALLAAAGTACYAGVLWARHRGVLQQAALVVATVVAAAAAAAVLLPDRGPFADGEAGVGLALWAAGVVWLLLGWGGVVAARPATYVLGGVPAVVGASMTVQTDWGTALALVTAAVLVGAGVALRDLVLLAVGSVAALVTVPVVMSRLFPDTLSAPLALLAVGAVLVAGALVTARRRARTPAAATPARGGPPGLAVGLAAAVVLGVTAVLLLAG